MSCHWLISLVAFVVAIFLTNQLALAQTDCAPQMDIAIVLDMSGSIVDNNPPDKSWDNWELIKDFVISVVRGLNISEDGVHVALCTFGNIGIMRFGLTSSYNKEGIISQIRNIPAGQGDTNTWAGLNIMRTQIFGPNFGARPNVPHIALVITDGFATINVSQTIPEAQAAYNDGIRIYVIGMTNLINETQLQAISSPPQVKDQNYWTTPDYKSLSTILTSVQRIACSTPKTVYPTCQVIDIAFATLIPDTLEQWNYVKSFMKTFITNYLPIGSDAARVSVVTYGYDVSTIQFSLNRYSNEKELKAAIDAIPHTPDFGYDILGLEKMLTVLNATRVSAQRIAVLLIGNALLEEAKSVQMATTLLNNGIRLIAYDILSSVPITTLRLLGSKSTDVIQSLGYNSMQQKIQQLGSLICSASSGTLCPRKADVILLLDESTSIVAAVGAYENWNLYMIGFALKLVDAFPVSPDLTRIGLIKFSDDANPNGRIYLNSFNNSGDLRNAISASKHLGGETNIANGIQQSREVMFTESLGARPGVPHILILITDGQANRNAERTIPQATLTKEAGIEIFTVGVTNQIDEVQLKTICSVPAETHYFYASNFNQLNTVILNLVDNSCAAAQTLPPTTTTTTTTTTLYPPSTTPTTTTTTTTTPTTTTTTTTPTTTTTTPTTTTTTTTTTPTPTTTPTTTTTTPTTTTPTTTTTTPTTTTTTPTTTTTTPTTTTTTTTTTLPVIIASPSTRNPNQLPSSGSCRKMADVVFIMHKSTNMQFNYYTTYLLGLSGAVTAYLNVEAGWQVGAVTFSDSAKVEFYLNNYTTVSAARSALAKCSYGGYGTNLAAALELTRMQLFNSENGARSGNPLVAKIAIIIVDYVTDNQTATLIQADQLRRAGVNVFVVGSGTILNMYELSAIASYPFSNNVRTVKTARNLLNLTDEVKRFACSDDSSCDLRPCSGSGSCTEYGNQIQCTCPAGTAGAKCDLACSNGGDVIFALDVSRGIGLNNFLTVVNFTSQIIQSLDVDSFTDGQTVSKVGMLTFDGSGARIQFHLNSYQTKKKKVPTATLR